MKNNLIILSVILLTSCEPTLLAEFEDKPVVTCYLENEVSPVITISKIISFRDDVNYSSEDINALSITITDETSDMKYIMEPIGEGQYRNPMLIAKTGNQYSLRFIYNGDIISSETTIPVDAEDVVFSATQLGAMISTTKMKSPDIEITWSNENNDYYIIEGITESSRQIQKYEENPAKGFQLNYTQGDKATLSSSDFNYFGDYEISILRILPEYVIMSQGSGNTSSSLVDIKGNIEGGYGLFTGVGRVKQIINIYEETMPSMP